VAEAAIERPVIDANNLVVVGDKIVAEIFIVVAEFIVASCCWES